jgi:hypothetical protein
VADAFGGFPALLPLGWRLWTREATVNSAANLNASARSARNQALQATRRAEVVLGETEAVWQQFQQMRTRSAQLRGLRLSARQGRLQFSAGARLQARLETMPVIEQAKGILIAQQGCTADEAFDLLRQASQRSNIRVRDLAAKIVAEACVSGNRGKTDNRRTCAAVPRPEPPQAAEPIGYPAAKRRIRQLAG